MQFSWDKLARKFSVCSLLLGILLLAFACCSTPLFGASSESSGPVIIAYVFPQNHVLQPGEVAPQKLTRINYAFANISNGVIVNGFPTDDANFAALNALKQQNPSLTVLVSVGGWLWSGNFSDMALTPASRATFIDSAAAFRNSCSASALFDCAVRVLAK